MYYIYSYKGYTISQVDDKFLISYPNDTGDASVYTYTLEDAYQFVDEMTSED